MAGRRWSIEETKRALFLYFQLPFGQMHHRNPEIIRLAREVDRTPDSIAMKLGNFASLDPKITSTGRRGLSSTSTLDREIWQEFQSDWTRYVTEISRFETTPIIDDVIATGFEEGRLEFSFEPYQGESVVISSVEQRMGQNFFRRAVLANYDLCCCVTGIAEPQLLNASHIVPWVMDETNRHNPANGLCLSATFDRAFDRGLMTITTSHNVLFSSSLLQHESEKTRSYFSKYDGTKIRQARRFEPDPKFLRWHNERFAA